MTAFTDARPGQIFTFTGSEDSFEQLYGIPVRWSARSVSSAASPVRVSSSRTR
jgi:hypothetical protein